MITYTYILYGYLFIIWSIIFYYSTNFYTTNFYKRQADRTGEARAHQCGKAQDHKGSENLYK